MKKLNRGRPKGTKNGQRFTEPWNPKKWKPLYDSILALAVVGMKQVDIARELNITPATVYLILSSTQGKVRLTNLQLKKNKITAESLKERFEALQDKALSRVENVINDNEIFEKVPLKIFDRSLNVLRTLKLVDGESEEIKSPLTPSVTNNTSNTINVITDRELLSQVSLGLDKALEAAKLHEGAFSNFKSGGTLKSIVGPGIQSKIP